MQAYLVMLVMVLAGQFNGEPVCYADEVYTGEAIAAPGLFESNDGVSQEACADTNGLEADSTSSSGGTDSRLADDFAQGAVLASTLAPPPERPVCCNTYGLCDLWFGGCPGGSTQVPCPCPWGEEN